MFDFSKTFRRLDPPWNTGQKKIFRKNYPITCSKHFWTLLGTRFWAFLEFWKILIFWKHFEDSTLHGTLGKKTFRKVPQNMFKMLFDNLGTILGVFAILTFFKFFENLSNTRPSIEHCAKKVFPKKYPKTCSKHFWTLLGTILSFFGILKNFDFLKTFRRLDPTWNTGQKKLFEKYPKTCSKCFSTIWERFCTFLEFWIF